jgi:hypothetical protein
VSELIDLNDIFMGSGQEGVCGVWQQFDTCHRQGFAVSFNLPATGYELYRYFGMFAIGPRDPPTARLPFWTRSRGLDRRGCGASDGKVCFFADAKVLRYLLYSPQLCRYIAISQLSRLSQLLRPDTSGDHTPQPSARAIRETNQKGQVQRTQ